MGKKSTDNELERKTFSVKEQIALEKQAATMRANAIVEANDLILGNENSTQAQRIAAMKSNAAQEIAILEADRKAKLADTSLTDAARLQVNRETNAAEIKEHQKSREEIRKLNVEYANRELDAQLDIAKAAVTTEAKAAELQSNDVKLSLDNRLAAYHEYEAKQESLINLDANRQKQKAGQTKDELFKIEVERQQKLIELANEGRAKQSQIILSALETQRKGLESGAQLDGLKGEVKALEELNQKFKEGKISLEAYKKQKDEISSKASEAAMRIEIGALEFIRGEYARHGQDTKDIDKTIYENKKHLLEMEMADEQKKIELKKQLGDRELELGRQVASTIADFVKGGYERELNAIQKQIDANNKLKETETANIEASSLSAQQKAAQQIELNAKVSAQNEALQRKQRDVKVKEAQFDREKAIFDIVANTAIAVSKALPNIPLSIVVGAIGAAQVVAVLAKPIPKYKDGVLSSPEGLALLHPGEMRVDPSGKISMTPDKEESLTYLERGTRIIPAHDVTDMLLQNFLSSSGRHMASSMADERLLHEVRDLKQSIVDGNRAQVGAIGRLKPPVVHVHNDAAFIAHIKNATS